MSANLRVVLVALLISTVWVWVGCDLLEDDGEEQGEGDVVFWVDEDYDEGYIDVWVEDTHRGRVTHYYPDEVPTCGAGGCVSVLLDAGTYDYLAESESGVLQWEESFTLEDGVCLPIQLDYPTTTSAGPTTPPDAREQPLPMDAGPFPDEVAVPLQPAG
ncbi:hypothetical protein GF324_12175 [bacterium]|nr:hypothetical protein [bacterium]